MNPLDQDLIRNCDIHSDNGIFGFRVRFQNAKILLHYQYLVLPAETMGFCFILDRRSNTQRIHLGDGESYLSWSSRDGCTVSWHPHTVMI